jgi:MptA/FolE2 family GTP cyclohydrolase
MNAPEKLLLPDIQSSPDKRNVAIEQVGVKNVRYPVAIVSADGSAVPTVATLTMTIGLPPEVKGTHMSRFLELLEAQDRAFTPHLFQEMAHDMLRRLDAVSGEIRMRFPYFVRKAAPVSGVASLLDYEVSWRVRCDGGKIAFFMEVLVPATSLCPCSKEISAYGAHNQRSHITIDAELRGDVTIEELIAIAERSASCELYGLLKRVDEKHVTERAYENPKFVEDLVRDVAVGLRADPRIGACTVEAENFESIHNHSAYARVALPAA